ncbi:THO complex subunit 4A [Linum perenne]
MSSSLDMALDEIILKNNEGGRRGGLASRGRGRGKGSSGGGFVPSIYGPGPDRRFGNRGGSFRCAPYAMLPPPPVPKMAMPVLEPMMVPQSDRGEGTMLYLSNLDYGVTNQDIKLHNAANVIPWDGTVDALDCLLQLLFSDIGELKRYSINYDKSGRSKGTGEVVYARREDALTAIKRYNNVQLDGKPLHIELLGVNMLAVPPPVFLPPVNMIRPNHPFTSGEESFRARKQSHDGGIGRARAQGQGQEQVRRKRASAKELDADLDKYHFEAMKLKPAQTSSN